MNKKKVEYYRLPFQHECTTDVDEYCRVWEAVGKTACEFFPGYEFVAYNPNIVLDLRKYSYDKERECEVYQSLDRVTLTPYSVFGMTFSKK